MGDALCEAASIAGADNWPQLLPALLGAVQPGQADRLREGALKCVASLAGEVAPALVAHTTTLCHGAQSFLCCFDHRRCCLA